MIINDTSSPETDLRLHPQDIDSGHSTQHSPEGAKSLSPQAARDSLQSFFIKEYCYKTYMYLEKYFGTPYR
ncbi:hypothetical protein Avbf_09377 [Armadillidium vulgare]|nr:hypothetical protein Avbf_09377 [Armadillidium vulgare]